MNHAETVLLGRFAPCAGVRLVWFKSLHEDDFRSQIWRAHEALAD